MRRLVFLVDMNAFYIACEMARNPKLKGRPAAVAGDPKNRSGIILSPNYDARKYGIKTTMLVHEAAKLCPDIVFVQPDHSYYNSMSRKVMNILSRYSPVIQQNSIDEAWLDLTGCEALFGKPVEIAEKIMSDIQNELDLWCSIGISENKFLAKMASEMKKPLGITELWRSDIKEKMWPLKVGDMYGVGRQTERKLNNLSIYTIGDLAKCHIGILIKEFGKYGEELHRLANGIDNSPVEENPHHDNRSISRSTTLPKDTIDMEYLKTILLELSEEVGLEARRQDYKGKTVYIIIKYSDFQTITRQKSVAPTYLTREIYETGVKLLRDNWNGTRPIRLIGIGIGGLEEDGMKQISLFDMAGDRSSIKKEEKLERALDTIKEKYGFDSIKRARLLK
ncbi:DNA polymerase IV [Fonticella tunisiensis]|uniref:DNA polymerase IV n=1 Tax=Fonticella tunisiensis TaxID=1096341 RepID=A0A4R7KE59_9CLOT|nr:DNA polymerase IV [Fonticella tunisiensis]TDT51343.1 DNA polymerase-4 [Fonticella tunisiensis]